MLPCFCIFTLPASSLLVNPTLKLHCTQHIQSRPTTLNIVVRIGKLVSLNTETGRIYSAIYQRLKKTRKADPDTTTVKQFRRIKKFGPTGDKLQEQTIITQERRRWSLVK